MSRSPSIEPTADESDVLEALAGLRQARPSPAHRAAARAAVAGRVAAAHAGTPPLRVRHRLPLLASIAVIPLLGIGAVGAAVGGGLPGPVSAILGTSADEAHQDGNGCDDVNPAVAGEPTPGGPAGCATGNSGEHRTNGSNAAAATSTPLPAGAAAGTVTTAGGGGSPASSAAHENGKGCDDVNPAVQGTPTPGGPIDCAVGNSADHRQNGKKQATETETANAASDAAHENGKGCDDVNPAVRGTPTPGGPVDCTVGNSEDHRQNGKKQATPTETPTPTDPTGTATSGGQGGGSAASSAAHEDGNGCDDVNPAVQGAPAQGGPADCEVGNSADHRQNGNNGAAAGNASQGSNGQGASRRGN